MWGQPWRRQAPQCEGRRAPPCDPAFLTRRESTSCCAPATFDALFPPSLSAPTRVLYTRASARHSAKPPSLAEARLRHHGGRLVARVRTGIRSPGRAGTPGHAGICSPAEGRPPIGCGTAAVRRVRHRFPGWGPFLSRRGCGVVAGERRCLRPPGSAPAAGPSRSPRALWKARPHQRAVGGGARYRGGLRGLPRPTPARLCRASRVPAVALPPPRTARHGGGCPGPCPSGGARAGAGLRRGVPGRAGHVRGLSEASCRGGTAGHTGLARWGGCPGRCPRVGAKVEIEPCSVGSGVLVAGGAWPASESSWGRTCACLSDGLVAFGSPEGEEREEIKAAR